MLCLLFLSLLLVILYVGFSNAIFLNIRVLRVREGLQEEEEHQERVSPVPRLVLQKAKDYN